MFIRRDEYENTRKTKIIRITHKVYTIAMAVKHPNHFNEGSWFSYLIMKGLEKLKEEEKDESK